MVKRSECGVRGHKGWGGNISPPHPGRRACDLPNPNTLSAQFRLATRESTPSRHICIGISCIDTFTASGIGKPDAR